MFSADDNIYRPDKLYTQISFNVKDRAKLADVGILSKMKNFDFGTSTTPHVSRIY